MCQADEEAESHEDREDEDVAVEVPETAETANEEGDWCDDPEDGGEYEGESQDFLLPSILRATSAIVSFAPLPAIFAGPVLPSL